MAPRTLPVVLCVLALVVAPVSGLVASPDRASTAATTAADGPPRPAVGQSTGPTVAAAQQADEALARLRNQTSQENRTVAELGNLTDRRDQLLRSTLVRLLELNRTLAGLDAASPADRREALRQIRAEIGVVRGNLSELSDLLAAQNETVADLQELLAAQNETAADLPQASGRLVQNQIRGRQLTLDLLASQIAQQSRLVDQVQTQLAAQNRTLGRLANRSAARTANLTRERLRQQVRDQFRDVLALVALFQLQDRTVQYLQLQVELQLQTLDRLGNATAAPGTATPSPTPTESPG